MTAKGCALCLSLYFKMKRSLHMPKISILLILVLFLSACVPIPNYAFLSPAVTGKVHRNGEPIENVTVYLEIPIGEKCSFKSENVTRTNSDGQFHFEPTKELQFILAMDPIHNWQVCIKDGDRQYQGWYQHGIGRLAGIGQPAPEVTLDCNLESKPHINKIGNTLGKTMGVCSSSWKYN